MAASTTLMTFMVCTPSNTRSVQLYGSWDNFSTPYPMKRDLRLGAGHWSGCHSFDNIICDGRVDGLSLPRNGGLKMGGTYWYYYKLDDEIEFHNSAEPSTTRCPLLPGQLVNELDVPFALSGSRKRAASISSTSSEQRTLDPEAKFVNPRPLPTPPTLLRLKTSPTLCQVTVTDQVRGGSVSAASDTDSYQETDFRSASSRIFHLPRKPSLDALLKLNSRRHNPASLRVAFEAPVAGSAGQSDKYQDIVNWIPDWPKNTQCPDMPKVEPKETIQPPPSRSAGGGLLLRSNSDEVVTLASFGAHRREQSRSRSLERPAQNSHAFDETPQLDLNIKRFVPQAPLSALIEVSTPDRTPAYGPLTGRRITLEALEGRNEMYTHFEKSLLTLPDNPSSAYPFAMPAKTSPCKISSRIAELSSRFSSTTIDTTSHVNSMIVDHEYNTQILGLTAVVSPVSSSESAIEDNSNSSDTTEGQHPDLFLEPLSSHTSLMDELADFDGYLRPRVMSAALSCTTISSSTSTTPTTLYGESEVTSSVRTSHATTIRTSGASYSHLQHYSLPEVENASAVTLKQYDSNNCTLIEGNRAQADHKGNLAHSETMQQLLDELSYLSAMIQQ